MLHHHTKDFYFQRKNKQNKYANLMNQIITWHKFNRGIENTLFPHGIISPMNDWEFDWTTVD